MRCILKVFAVLVPCMIGAYGCYETNTFDLIGPSISGGLTMTLESEVGWPWIYRFERTSEPPRARDYVWWGRIQFLLNLAVWGLLSLAIGCLALSLCTSKYTFQFSLLHLMAVVTGVAIAISVLLAPWPENTRLPEKRPADLQSEFRLLNRLLPPSALPMRWQAFVALGVFSAAFHASARFVKQISRIAQVRRPACSVLAIAESEKRNSKD